MVHAVPRWMRVRDRDELEQIRNRTSSGYYALSETEKWWRDQYDVLCSHGYRLRPRYHPAWKPSWLDNDLNPDYCEDALEFVSRPVMDAVRISDGKVVAVKRLRRIAREYDILRHFSEPERRSNSMNHCVPFYDSFIDGGAKFAVVQYLRPFDDPPFEAIGEVMDFVQQTLEGLVFMHKELIAHLDCSDGNIMMDASSMYPHGYHPVYRFLDPDGIYDAKHYRRIDSSVKYYFIDFDLSVNMNSDPDRMILGSNGQDQDVPELSEDIPYKPFPVDVFILGNLYRKALLDKYSNLECLRPLVDAMTQAEPNARPTSEQAYSQYQNLPLPTNVFCLRWRLRCRDETLLARIVYDTLAIFRQASYLLRIILSSPLGLLNVFRKLFSPRAVQ